MEDGAVIDATLHQIHEVATGEGSGDAIHLHSEVPLAGGDGDGGFAIQAGHGAVGAADVPGHGVLRLGTACQQKQGNCCQKQGAAQTLERDPHGCRGSRRRMGSAQPLQGDVEKAGQAGAAGFQLGQRHGLSHTGKGKITTTP